jgi:diguanylate cyclase (GGDEF)-like protein
VLTDILLFNQPIKDSQERLREMPVWDITQLALPYNQNMLSFEFAALGFASPERQQYRYILEGLDQRWNEVGADRRSVTYTSLPPGTYTFRVQASNDDGIWSEQMIAMQITIAPPWWETWWFRVLAGILIIGLVLGAFRYRVHRIEKRARQLETLVAERTAHLESEIHERSLAEAALRKANLELERLAVLDELTRVANRRRFDQYLISQWHQEQPNGISLLLCDVDFFKRYNDTYGHQAGDRCLQQVAHAISRVVGHSGDLVARYGGEEFAVVLPDTSLLGAIHVAETIRQELQRQRLPHASSDASPYVTLSIGVACLEATEDRRPAELIEAADLALYDAKRGGRDCAMAYGLEESEVSG